MLRIISDSDVDEGTTISCFLLAYLNLIYGDIDAVEIHLQGMNSMFNTLISEDATRIEPVPQQRVMSPLTVLMRRMAMRLDFISSIITGRSPVLPGYSS